MFCLNPHSRRISRELCLIPILGDAGLKSSYLHFALTSHWDFGGILKKIWIYSVI